MQNRRTEKGGERLKRKLLVKYRGKRSQSEMGKLYGVSQQTWATWENGISSPKIPTMKRIEVDSGFPMSQIFLDLFTIKRGNPKGGTHEKNKDSTD